MTSLNLSEQSARQLDIEKRKLEARLLSDIKKIFRNISIDASNLYKATGNLPNKELASNYNNSHYDVIIILILITHEIGNPRPRLEPQITSLEKCKIG